jgi:hypothetical protein
MKRSITGYLIATFRTKIDVEQLEGDLLSLGLEDLCKPMEIASWLYEAYFGDERVGVDQV